MSYKTKKHRVIWASELKIGFLHRIQLNRMQENAFVLNRELLYCEMPQEMFGNGGGKPVEFTQKYQKILFYVIQKR